MILSGVEPAQDILNKAADNIKKLNLKPVLGIISVGEDKASQVYVKGKIKDAEKVGIKPEHFKLPEKTSEEELLTLVDKLNKDKKITGFIVQLPLPKHIDEQKVIEAIYPSKDVDGFHPINMGKLFLGFSRDESMIPATPYGIIKMLEYHKIELEGKNAVVIGRSNIVGKPTALLLLQKNCTVSICHSKTKNLSEYTKNADIIIVAVGKPHLLKADMVKKDAYVIDVGINRKDDGLVGDVDFENVCKVAHCSPVPKGVGPMTRAMLMYNIVKAASLKR